MCQEDRIDWQSGNVGQNQHNCGINREGHKLARRKIDVKEGEDAPGYASKLHAARGM